MIEISSYMIVPWEKDWRPVPARNACAVYSLISSVLFFGGVLGVVWTFDNYVYRFSNKLEYKEKQMIWPSFPGLVLACEELWGITQMEVLNPRRISQNSFNFVIVSSWS